VHISNSTAQATLHLTWLSWAQPLGTISRLPVKSWLDTQGLA
jgi:hypothetical protein